MQVSPAALPVPHAERGLFRVMEYPGGPVLPGLSGSTGSLEGVRNHELSLCFSLEYDDLLEWFD